jgi:hypothetical protein
MMSEDKVILGSLNTPLDVRSFVASLTRRTYGEEGFGIGLGVIRA